MRPAPIPAERFDPADVPRAEPEHLAHLMRILIREGQGLLLLRGVDDAVLEALEADFWREFGGGTASGVAAIVRFRALIDAFASRRLRALLLNEGLPVLARVFRVAAGMRLNAARGLSPQGLVSGVAAEAARIPLHRSARGEAAARSDELHAAA